MRYVVILVALLAAGCAASPARIHKYMDPWLGKDINELIAKWGAPSGTFPLPNGGLVYTWVYQGETLIQNVPIGRVNYTTIGASYCRFDWTASAAGVVQTYHQEGRCSVH